MNESLTHTNLTIFQPTRMETAKAWSIVCIWLFGILLSILVTLIVMASSGRLKKEEFLILITYNVLSTVYKISSTIYLSFKFLIPDRFDSCVYLMTYELALALLVISLMTLFYYSVYQVSLLKITKLFLLLVHVVHSTRTFAVFQALVVTSITTITIAYSVVRFYVTDRACPSIDDLDDKLFDFLKFVISLPTVLPLAVYVFGVCYIVYSRFHLKGPLSTNEARKLRKNLKIMLKFSSLPLISLCSSMLQTFVYYLPKICVSCVSEAFFYIGLLGYLLFTLQPVVFLFVHSILKQTFLLYYRRVIF